MAVGAKHICDYIPHGQSANDGVPESQDFSGDVCPYVAFPALADFQNP